MGILSQSIFFLTFSALYFPSPLTTTTILTHLYQYVPRASNQRFILILLLVISNLSDGLSSVCLSEGLFEHVLLTPLYCYITMAAALHTTPAEFDDILRPDAPLSFAISTIEAADCPLAVIQPDGPSLASTLKVPESPSKYLSQKPTQHIFSLSDFTPSDYLDGSGGVEGENAPADITVAGKSRIIHCFFLALIGTSQWKFHRNLLGYSGPQTQVVLRPASWCWSYRSLTIYCHRFCEPAWETDVSRWVCYFF